MTTNILMPFNRDRGAIEEYIDMDSWTRALEIEAVEKESMHGFHKAWTDSLFRKGSK